MQLIKEIFSFHFKKLNLHLSYQGNIYFTMVEPVQRTFFISVLLNYNVQAKGFICVATSTFTQVYFKVVYTEVWF